MANQLTDERRIALARDDGESDVATSFDPASDFGVVGQEVLSVWPREHGP
ncbi:hypothetical protein [Gordonia humi]